MWSTSSSLAAAQHDAPFSFASIHSSSSVIPHTTTRALLTLLSSSSLPPLRVLNSPSSVRSAEVFNVRVVGLCKVNGSRVHLSSEEARYLVISVQPFYCDDGTYAARECTHEIVQGNSQFVWEWKQNKAGGGRFSFSDLPPACTSEWLHSLLVDAVELGPDTWMEGDLSCRGSELFFDFVGEAWEEGNEEGKVKARCNMLDY